jgi:hypothetical protein
MERDEKIKHVQQKDGKVFDTKNINVQQRYLNTDYNLVEESGKLGLTGHLAVFRLEPKKPGLPSFAARWDGGNRSTGRERTDLDIDIYGVPDEEVKKFRAMKDGYSGHHTNSISNDSHTYDVSIKTPSVPVFDGTVSFRLLRKMELSASTSPKVGLETMVVRATPEPKKRR